MSSKRFKYQEFLNKFDNCPPNNFKEVELKAFRWVFIDCSEESFLPVLIIDPSRHFETDALNCTAYALSLFESIEGALKKYKILINRKPSLVETLGDNIAAFEIYKNDGRCSLPEIKNFSHFSFHPYENIDLSKKEINIVKILDNNGNFKR